MYFIHMSEVFSIQLLRDKIHIAIYNRFEKNFTFRSFN